MNIKTEEIRSGMHTGKKVWICHYLQPDLDKKPLRNVPPTHVLIRSNDELPKNKRVYYSLDHFAPLSNAGKTLLKVISPVDNTGYRSACGNELYVFTDKNECVFAWNQQIEEACARILDRELYSSNMWKTKREDLIKNKMCLTY